MKINQKKYTHSSKMATLKILQKNDFNYLKTEKATGVNRSTLKKWEKQFGVEAFSGKSPTEQALEEITCEMKYQDMAVIRNLFQLRMLSLKNIMTLAETEKRIDPLINLLKFVAIELEKYNTWEKEETKNIDFFKMITDSLTKKSNPTSPEFDDE
jgi:hypothetical protein